LAALIATPCKSHMITRLLASKAGLTRGACKLAHRQGAIKWRAGL
jgi:hypothetical protein